MSCGTIYDRLEQSHCACGEGVVIRHSYKRMGFRNRSENGYYGEEIQCNECRRKYHIEYNKIHNSCPLWEGDDINDIPYLIPNGMTLKHDVSQNNLYFYFDLDEKIVSYLEKDKLQNVFDDMIKNKSNTRLKLAESKGIVELYYQRYHKRRLQNIIMLLQKCICDYDSYEWTFEKMQEHKMKEQQRINANIQIINNTLAQSYKLEFTEHRNYEPQGEKNEGVLGYI